MHMWIEIRTPPSMFFLISSILFPKESLSFGMWWGRATLELELEVEVEVEVEVEPVEQMRWIFLYWLWLININESR